MDIPGVDSGDFRKGSIQRETLPAKRSDRDGEINTAGVFALLIYFCYDSLVEVYRAHPPF